MWQARSVSSMTKRLSLEAACGMKFVPTWFAGRQHNLTLVKYVYGTQVESEQWSKAFSQQVVTDFEARSTHLQQELRK